MRFKDLDKEMFRANVESGTSDKMLAERYGVSIKTITRWRDSLGLASHWEPERHGCGTPAAYARGCRCGDCRQANARAHQKAVTKMCSVGLPDGDKRHGTYSGYTQWGCRCDACRRVNTERSNAYLTRSFGSPATRLWSADEDDMVRAGRPALEIAQLTGRSVGAVYQRRKALGFFARARR